MLADLEKSQIGGHVEAGFGTWLINQFPAARYNIQVETYPSADMSKREALTDETIRVEKVDCKGRGRSPEYP